MACIGSAKIGGLVQSPSKNACALGKGLCTMEQSGADPDWDNCKNQNNSKNSERVQGIIGTYIAHPDAVRPPHLHPVQWEGIPASDWFKMVMNRHFN